MAKLIQRLQGQGRVLSGSLFIADVQYSIEIYEDSDRTTGNLSGGSSVLPVVRRIQLRITKSSAPIRSDGATLTLQMSDGSTLDFVKQPHGIDVLGPIQPASG